jgi:hypothetical protein
MLGKQTNGLRVLDVFLLPFDPFPINHYPPAPGQWPMGATRGWPDQAQADITASPVARHALTQTRDYPQC